MGKTIILNPFDYYSVYWLSFAYLANGVKCENQIISIFCRRHFTVPWDFLQLTFGVTIMEKHYKHCRIKWRAKLTPDNEKHVYRQLRRLIKILLLWMDNFSTLLTNTYIFICPLFFFSLAITDYPHHPQIKALPRSHFNCQNSQSHQDSSSGNNWCLYKISCQFTQRLIFFHLDRCRGLIDRTTLTSLGPHY